MSNSRIGRSRKRGFENRSEAKEDFELDEERDEVQNMSQMGDQVS